MDEINLDKKNILSIDFNEEIIDEVIELPEEKSQDDIIVEKVIEKVIPLIPIPKDWESPTEEQLIELIEPRIPKPKDGKTPTKTEIKAIVKPLIPTAKEIAEIVLPKIPKPKDWKDWEKWDALKFSNLTPYEKQVLTWPQWSNGVWVPRGGTIWQKLVKTSSRDFDTEWTDNTDVWWVWWQITGTLSNQTDLQTALNAKVNKSGDTMTGDLLVPDEAYWAWWNGSMEVPTKNAIYDKIQTITESDTLQTVTDRGSNTTNSVSVTKTSLGATTTAGLQVINSTAATGGTPSQVSPSFLRKGNWFFSNSSTSFPFEVQDYVSGDTNIVAYGKHIWQYRANSGSWAEFMSFSSAPLGQGFSITPWQSLSNGTPWTTRNMTINNTGTNSWIDWKFSGVAKSYLGADSSGAMKFYAGGGSYFEYYQMAGGSLFSYNYPTAFVHSWNGLFGWSVNAGSQSTPTSTLQSQWSFASKGRRVTTNYTLTSTDSVIYADATTPTCSGTPSAACSSWTNQTDCEKWDAHGGCSWYAGSDCSEFNNTDVTTCESGHSGCTYDTASCSWIWDESTCSGTSGCSWSGTDCSGLDEWPCGSTSGCSVNTSDCSSFNGNESSCSWTSGCSVSSSNTCPSQWDESGCVSAWCSWDGMTCTGDNSTCSGTYYTGCSGTYYTCTGTYYTGTCSGTYGAACQGTSACAGIDDSTNCWFETGCTWTTSITINLPSVVTAPERHYWIYNDNTWSADVILFPFSGDTVDRTTSYTLGTYKDSVHIHSLAESTSCDSFNEGACTPSGCTKVYSNCSWDSMSSTCSGNAVCDGIGDEWTCTSTTYFSSCSGNYYSVKNWYLLSRS